MGILPLPPPDEPPLSAYKVDIEVEVDETGYHAVLISAEDDRVLHITDSFPRPEEAQLAAQSWWQRHVESQRSAS